MDDRAQMIIIWLLFAFLCADAATIANETTDPTTQNSGFLSIDCGVDEDYLDETTGLQYESDKNFLSTGENANVLPEYDSGNDDLDKLWRSLRYFPEGKKNCYPLKPNQGKNNNYLIRAFFSYGNYDRKNQTPKFDLYLGVHYWFTTEFDTLELRPLNNSIYRTDSGFATLYRTYDAGSPNDTMTRYKDDIYDRIWRGFMRDDWIVVNTSENLDIQSTADSFKVPSEVLRTAVQPPENLTSLTFSDDHFYSASYYNVYFYFAEVQRIPRGRKREFTITLNGVLYGPYSPPYLQPLTVPCEKVRSLDGFIQFSIDQTVQSDLPPILNGFEIITNEIDIYNASATSLQDVVAITEIKRIYKIDRPDWQGDPCMPRDFSWTGLNCTTYNNTPRITSVDLSSSALSGPVASEFSNLNALRTLDLSNNNLAGVVPEFLAELQNLVTLDISGNQLTGPLPQSLVEKSRNGTLKLSFGLKPNPPSSGDKRKRSVVIPILVSIIVFLALLVILFIFSMIRRHGVIGSGGASILISRNRSFTYSEIASMTNNFESIIGEGGFGKVYLGELNDGTQVAVKLLSQSSKQGFKEFLSEVQLLIMVYHRNLVSLIGYCNDDGTIALVYEYMENGNLQEYLSGRSSHVLTWKERLQIAVDAAQGLEYLHNGCKPPIVHRDLKTSNILLNENLVAKISDFGLSRVFATDKDTHVSTAPAGTFGYVDPEFYVTGNLNKKSDVYSFGIILFELITGQPVAIRGEEYSTHILQWVTPIIKNGDIQSIVDQRLEGEFNTNSAWRAVEIAMSCVPTIAIQRPNMSDVLVELKECMAMDIASGGSQRMKNSMPRSSNGLEMSYADFDTDTYPAVR